MKPREKNYQKGHTEKNLEVHQEKMVQHPTSQSGKFHNTEHLVKFKNTFISEMK
jgi:hypothetical protein